MPEKVLHNTSRSQVVGPSAAMVEQLRCSVERRIADHQQRLYKDQDESRDAMNVLEQVLRERKARVALRPKSQKSQPRAPATLVRTSAPGAQQKPSIAGDARLHAPLIDVYELPQSEHAANRSASHHHDQEAPPSSSLTQEEIELLHAENDAMDMFLLRHDHDQDLHVEHPRSANCRNEVPDTCERSRQNFHEELQHVVRGLEAMLLHAARQQPEHRADRSLRQVSRQAKLCEVADSLKDANDALMQGCTILEAELDRYTSSGHPTRRGVPWLVAQSMLPQPPVTRPGAPLVVAAGWARFAADTQRCVEASSDQLQHTSAMDDAINSVQDGLRCQLDMILNHLRSALHQQPLSMDSI
jgi:hypothetical protein